MASCLEYAKISTAAYYLSPNQFDAKPAGHMVDGWTVQMWMPGHSNDDGFQGGIWTNDREVVVGFCGTNSKQADKKWKDIKNDLQITARMLPNQWLRAQMLARAAIAVAGNRVVSITGHSLGGGLAQVVGNEERVRFVTFNAPAMRRVIGKSNLSDTQAVNFRIGGDPVSVHGIAGGHVGMVVDLSSPNKRLRLPFGMPSPPLPSLASHSKVSCYEAVKRTDWADIDPFGELA